MLSTHKYNFTRFNRSIQSQFNKRIIIQFVPEISTFDQTKFSAANYLVYIIKNVNVISVIMNQKFSLFASRLELSNFHNNVQRS